MQGAEHYTGDGLLGRSYRGSVGHTDHYSANGGWLGSSYIKPNGRVDYYSENGERLGGSFTRINGEATYYDDNGKLAGRLYKKADDSTEHWFANGGRLGRSYYGNSSYFTMFGHKQKKEKIQDNVCSFGVADGGRGDGGAAIDMELGFVGMAAIVIVAVGFLVVYSVAHVAIDVYKGTIEFLQEWDNEIEKECYKKRKNNLRHYDMITGVTDMSDIEEEISEAKKYKYVTFFFTILFFIFLSKIFF